MSLPVAGYTAQDNKQEKIARVESKAAFVEYFCQRWKVFVHFVLLQSLLETRTES